MLKKSSGFTLAEVLMVVIIIGILSSMILPRFLNKSDRAAAGEAVTIIGSLKRAEYQRLDERGTFLPAADGTLDVCVAANNVNNELSVDFTGACAGRWTYHLVRNGVQLEITARFGGNAANSLFLRTQEDNNAPDCWSGTGTFAPAGGVNWPALAPVC